MSFDDMSLLFQVPSRTARYLESGVNTRGNLISQDVINSAVSSLKKFDSLIESNVSNTRSLTAGTLKVFFDNEVYRESSEWDEKLPLAALHRAQQQRIKLKLAQQGIDVKLVLDEKELLKN